MIPTWSDAMHEAITTEGVYEARLSTGEIVTFTRLGVPESKTTPQYVDFINALYRRHGDVVGTEIPRLAVRASAILTLYRTK